jgi:Baseplate J-like protein
LSFVDLSSLGLASTQSQLYAVWLAYMQAAYPGYNPAPTNPEVVQATGIAALMADVAQTGVVVPDAIFRQFGTLLFGIPYLFGASATASVQVTAVDTSGYTLPAGTDLTLGAYGFQTQSDLTIPNGTSTGTVTAIAVAPGSAYNGATNPTSFVSVINWVSSVTALGPASGGVDQESDTDYQNRLAALFTLITPRPITASDYATLALSFSPASGTDQEEIGRATSIDGYVQGAASFTVSENSTTTLTVTSPPGTGITAAQGATITGSGIPANTIVVASTSSTITLSQAATATATGVTATVGGTLGNERTVTVGVTLADGTATNSDTKTALQTWLESLREVNFIVDVIDPTYTPVYVTTEVHLYAGFDPTATGLAVQAAIMQFLSPTNFGLPPFSDVTAWLSGTTVYYSRLLAVIQNVPGVDYVVDGYPKVGLGSSPTGTADLVLPGPLGLPTSTTSTVSVPTIV